MGNNDLPELGLSDALMDIDEEKTELDKVLELLLDPKNIQHNTDLTRNEIVAFSVLATLAQRHNLPVLQEFLQHNLTLRVSRGRAGRKEWVKIVARHMEQPQQEEYRGGRFGRLMGRR